MGLLRAVTGMVIEAAKLPVSVVKDVVDAPDSRVKIGSHTRENLEQIKREAEKADK